MVPQWIIERKRDGHELSADEIQWFINGYTDGTIPDYQMSALAMAVYFKGMSFDETTALTEAMLQSGDQITTTSIKQPTVDKHSTGGIGDKVSLILAPLAAACGAAIPMLSGRGLGITGGTLDKLESIPGYRTHLTSRDFCSIIRRCGCSIMGQTERIAPADRKLYALRDVTATVPSIPLIAASIMSKKLAEGTQSLVLDVKWGCGAFMKNRTLARKLASTMVEIGARMGRRMVAVLTRMDHPLGTSVGNSLEVVESIHALRGQGAPDLMEVTLALSDWMLVLAGLAGNLKEARKMAIAKLASGEALDRFRTMIRLHGGDERVVDDPSRLPTTRIQEPWNAPATGYIAGINADRVGRTCMALGAGRQQVTDPVDHAVGLSAIHPVGTKVRKGDPLLIIHANRRDRLADAKTWLTGAHRIVSAAVRRPSLVGPIIHPGSRNHHP
ncbi:MAG: thymidine phosphorylase [Lentisphaerae bacterium RIFOXYC12_FULL_60_16]|nr:MAG: thymidine phosphorylase [Lentisphaerae bacterium RIFOXYC12_FULL_60_16]OGV83816.1 MAG: thymidine phosphorylase [Lentisphaerae bacterium RIFOXYB12_FULL_60_10]